MRRPEFWRAPRPSWNDRRSQSDELQGVKMRSSGRPRIGPSEAYEGEGGEGEDQENRIVEEALDDYDRRGESASYPVGVVTREPMSLLGCIRVASIL
jgi:hypothetical protein